MSFFAGQTVMCIKRGMWTGGGFPCFSPQYGDVCVVDEVVTYNDGTYISLLGHDPEDVFWVKYFRPMDPLDLQLERIEKEGAPVEHELETA